MLDLTKIAVTGSVACGKSSVCRFFKELGAHVVSADEIVHQLLSPDTIVGQQIITLIGQDIVVNHQIDRSKIAKKVFNQFSLLQSLENLLHPEVMREIEKQYEQAKTHHTSPLFIVEMPLLFEKGWESFFDIVVTVDADEELCKTRFEAKGLGTREDYAQRMSRLLSQKEKMKRSDFVIVNNGCLNGVRNQVLELYNKMIKKKSQPPM